MQAGQTESLLLGKDASGYWSGFLAEAQEGDCYHYWVIGAGSSGYKRDPYARELARDQPFPKCGCILRSPNAYPWHDAAFVTPDFSDMIIYQIHVGTYAISQPGKTSTFLDIIGKIPYLVALGINVLQPLPIDEVETDPSMGYDGADYFSPDFDYAVTDPRALEQYLTGINQLLRARSLAPLTLDNILPGPAQLKALVDLCHMYAIAVMFDVVYNHAGGFSVNGNLDDECLYYFDRAVNVGNNNDSLYFTDQDRGAGGLSFALWNDGVRQFIINNAEYYIREFHADGFRYDEISDLLSMNRDSGWSFCCDLTSTIRFIKPRLLQNAEFWPGEVADYPKATTSSDRVIAYHRRLDDGQDVVVVATLSETNWYDYEIGFPFAGQWSEIFNSDVYDNWVNPSVAGNGGGITATGQPLQGMQASAGITIPANGLVVFAPV